MNSRLGRVISTEDDGDVNDDGNDDDDNDGDDVENRTTSHRRWNMRRSTNRSRTESDEEETETSDQSKVLISALHQLHRLATLDSTEYQQRLLENALPDLQTEQPKSLHCPTLAESSASTQISQLSPPIQTPLVQLSMSIHRLHAAVANITQEVDGHTDEVHDLQSQLAALRHRNQQVESAAKKFHKKNLKLKQQAQHDRKMAHSLQHKVHQYEAQLESQGYQLLASQVHQHEIQLQLSKSQHSSNNGSEDGRGQLRERVDSNMSDFLDLELESQDDNNSTKSVQTTETDSQDTLPVLRFSADGGIVTPDRNINSSCEQQGSSPATNSSVVDEVNHRESSSSEKRSRVSRKVQQPIGFDTAMKTRNTSASFSNRFVKFLGTRAITNYNLKIGSPCNIQFVGLPLNSSTNENKTEHRSPVKTEVVQDHGIVQTNETSTRSLDAGLAPDSQKSTCAFAVCGLDGFNAEINMKPTIGAQLVKINGKVIGDECTLEILHNILDKKRAKPKVLTFRNELWDTAQTKVLNAAILRVECKKSARTGSVNSSNDERKEKQKNDGACLFESHNQTRTNSFEGDGIPQSDGGLTNTPLQRVRTASTDSVGNAIHGFGNFLQNLNHVEDGI
jgi:hypothetical protein